MPPLAAEHPQAALAGFLQGAGEQLHERSLSRAGMRGTSSLTLTPPCPLRSTVVSRSSTATKTPRASPMRPPARQGQRIASRNTHSRRERRTPLWQRIATCSRWLRITATPSEGERSGGSLAEHGRRDHDGEHGKDAVDQGDVDEMRVLDERVGKEVGDPAGDAKGHADEQNREGDADEYSDGSGGLPRPSALALGRAGH